MCLQRFLKFLKFANALSMATLKGLRNVFPILPVFKKPIMSPEARKGQTIIYTIQEIKYNFRIIYCKNYNSKKYISQHVLINDM